MRAITISLSHSLIARACISLTSSFLSCILIHSSHSSDVSKRVRPHSLQKSGIDIYYIKYTISLIKIQTAYKSALIMLWIGFLSRRLSLRNKCSINWRGRNIRDVLHLGIWWTSELWPSPVQM